MRGPLNSVMHSMRAAIDLHNHYLICYIFLVHLVMSDFAPNQRDIIRSAAQGHMSYEQKALLVATLVTKLIDDFQGRCSIGVQTFVSELLRL